MSDESPKTPADLSSAVEAPRPELAELRERIHATEDAARPDAVARRRKTGQRTVRENLEDLLDEGGKAINMAALLEIDAVIDPADTRAWLVRGLCSAAAANARPHRERRRFVDTW